MKLLLLEMMDVLALFSRKTSNISIKFLCIEINTLSLVRLMVKWTFDSIGDLGLAITIFLHVSLY